jgi:hypothetical protein
MRCPYWQERAGIPACWDTALHPARARAAGRRQAPSRHAERAPGRDQPYRAGSHRHRLAAAIPAPLVELHPRDQLSQTAPRLARAGKLLEPRERPASSKPMSSVGLSPGVLTGIPRFDHSRLPAGSTAGRGTAPAPPGRHGSVRRVGAQRCNRLRPGAPPPPCYSIRPWLPPESRSSRPRRVPAAGSSSHG